MTSYSNGNGVTDQGYLTEKRMNKLVYGIPFGQNYEFFNSCCWPSFLYLSTEFDWEN